MPWEKGTAAVSAVIEAAFLHQCKPEGGALENWSVAGGHPSLPTHPNLKHLPPWREGSGSPGGGLSLVAPGVGEKSTPSSAHFSAIARCPFANLPKKDAGRCGAKG
jgi:hypothetical protein